MSKTKKIPEFKREAEERAFRESHDSSDYEKKKGQKGV